MPLSITQFLIIIFSLSLSQHITRPKLPKLSRKIVKSARVNLNRYWHKFEELFSTDTQPKPQLLNNQEFMRQQNEINEILSKNYQIDRVSVRGHYKHFHDESLYHGVNLKPVYEESCQCVCHGVAGDRRAGYMNRFSLCVMQNLVDYDDENCMII